jgi:hypothetical protein
MKWGLFILIPLLFSCKQHANPDENDYILRSKLVIDSLYWAKRDAPSYTYEGPEGTFMVGHFFDKESAELLMRYYINDSTEQIIIKRNTLTHWYTIFSETISPAKYGGFEGFVTIKDFNGDHIPDVKVVKDFYENMHPSESSVLWLYRNDHFVRVKHFDEIRTAETNEKDGIIYSVDYAGCQGLIWDFATYKIEADTVRRLQLVGCDMCMHPESDSCNITIDEQDPIVVPFDSIGKYIPAFFGNPFTNL